VHLVTVVVLVAGLVLTALLTVLARTSTDRTEGRLTQLQARLSGQVLQNAVFGLTSDLDRIVGLSAESPDPAGTFRSSLGPLVGGKGPFTTGLLVSMAGSPHVVARLGSAPIRDPTGPAVDRLYGQAARSSGLVTSWVVSGRTQRFGYLVSARGPDGVYVVAVGEPLPSNRRLTIPASSPESVLNLAVYFGRHASAARLIETNAAHLPIPGPTAAVTVPFGTNHLLLVASPRVALAGTLSELLPWLVVVVGVLLTLVLTGTTEWLARRRSDAEATASATEDLYQEQRSVARLLQLALLPKTLPDIPGTDLAARYLPASNAADVGGDWYSVIAVDDHAYVFVVGDVSGHGVEAATIMAPLRFTVRSLARLGLPPAEVLAWANQEIDAVEDGRIATVLVAKVDARHHRLTVASAGHPPPLLIAGGTCQVLDLCPGPPLGLPGSTYEERTFELAAGSTLLAYTDGLVERRDRAVDVGIDQLRELLAAGAAGAAGTAGADGGAGGAGGAEAMLETVLRVFGGDTEDDTALLVVRT
jgi:type II secretory pathway pseudopilin PulG